MNVPYFVWASVAMLIFSVALWLMFPLLMVLSRTIVNAAVLLVAMGVHVMVGALGVAWSLVFLGIMVLLGAIGIAIILLA